MTSRLYRFINWNIMSRLYSFIIWDITVYLAVVSVVVINILFIFTGVVLQTLRKPFP